jgi:diguanylate cyclase (GGDEF)-like protein
MNRWKIGVVVVAAALCVLALVEQTPDQRLASLFFAALVFLASFLRIERGDTSVGFEAAIAFGALIIFHSPSVAFVAVFLGSAWPRLDRLYNAAQLALSYGVVGLLYTLAVERDAKLSAKMAGFVLLLVGYVVAQLVFASVRRYFEDDASPIDFRRVLFVQGKLLLLVTPVVAIEVMLFDRWGIVSFAVAFVPVLLVAHSMRNEEEAAKHNAGLLQRNREMEESSQLNSELLRRNRELAIVMESSTQILSAETDHETLRRLMSLATKLAKLKAAAVVTWEANLEATGTVYRFGECLPTDQEVMRWVDAAGFAQSAPSRALVLQSNMRKFPLSDGDAIQLLIGVQTPEVIYGILIFETEDRSILQAGSLNLLTLLVNQTALSLQDQLLRREMREKTILLESNAATMTTILDVSNSLIGQFDVDAALTHIAQSIRKALGFEVVVFSLHETRRDEFVRRAQAGLDVVWEEVRKKHVSSEQMSAFFNSEFRVSNSFFVSHSVLRQSEHDFFVHPEDADERYLKPDEWHPNDILLVPLMSGDEMMGYLSVRDPHDRRIPSIDKVKTLEIFATQAVTALQSARQYEEIKRLTFIDALTPAYNHRFFQDALSKEVHRHSRTRRSLALAMLDIDNFKRVNDSFGHPVGDEILKGLVEELMQNARDSDVVARYGGEEFAIIFPDIPASSARDAANRMRELIERRDFPLPALDRTLHITVSIGVAVYPHDGANPAELISRADAALYFAKKNGKNQVAMAEDVASAEAM